MKLSLWFLALCLLPALAWAEEGSPKPGQVTKLDGTKAFGIIEVTDDYTIRISNDSGIQKIPLALLGEKDFQKYGFQKDRSKDGRFWSERKDALEDEKESESHSKKPNADSPMFELKLKEIAAFQPVIDVYEKTLADKKSKESETAKNDSNTSSPAEPVRALFSQPGLSGPLPQAFNGMGNGPAAPAVSAGSSLLSPLSGATSVIPTAP